MGFFDDMLLLVRGKTLEESKSKVRAMIEKEGGGMDFSCTHQCGFTLDKYQENGAKSGEVTHHETCGEKGNNAVGN